MTFSLEVQPVVGHRVEQPYVGIRTSATLESFAAFERRLAELLAWMRAEGVEPAGPPFCRYHVIDMFRELQVEAGVPVAARVDTAGDVRVDVLPAGRYVTYTHVGPPDTHIDVIAAIFDWASAKDLKWDMTPSPEGEVWGCRLASTLSQPSKQLPDAGLTTEFAFRLAD
ncbi:GyrI-like domain-containing protein [Streptomyces sp. NPDC008150]|uniref:GyrI-like domain-containing protein n=1 Tax=Streptomyces sp. NPDC008150 TaxID=3364816 RepID=UPI0036E710EA